MGRGSRYTDEELLEYLVKAKEELGDEFSCKKITELEGFPHCRTFYNRFGNFNKACEKASVEHNSPPEERYTEEELVEYLRKAREKIGEDFILNDINSLEGFPGLGTYQNRFGDADSIYGLIGEERRRASYYSDEELLEFLRRVEEENGFVNGNFIKEMDGPSYQTFCTRFDGFVNACEEAGVEHRYHTGEFRKEGYFKENGFGEKFVKLVDEKGIYGYFSFEEFMDLINGSDLFDDSFDTVKCRKFVDFLTVESFDGLNIVSSTSNVFIDNKELSYGKRIERAREEFEEEWLKEFFDKCFYETGRCLKAVRAGIHYLMYDGVTQSEAGELFGLSELTVRNVLQDWRDDGVFESELGERFVERFEPVWVYRQ